MEACDIPEKIAHNGGEVVVGGILEGLFFKGGWDHVPRGRAGSHIAGRDLEQTL